MFFLIRNVRSIMLEFQGEDINQDDTATNPAASPGTRKRQDSISQYYTFMKFISNLAILMHEALCVTGTCGMWKWLFGTFYLFIG